MYPPITSKKGGRISRPGRKRLAKMLLWILGISFLFSGCGSGGISPLTIDILKVGKADASVFRCGDSCMIIDCGEEDDGQDIVAFVQDAGIQTVDVLIVTHFDKDHVGGAPAVLEQLEIGRILIPDYEGTGTAYGNFIDAMSEQNLSAERLTEVTTLTLGDMAIQIEPSDIEIPEDAEEEYDNDMSLITTITHGAVRLLFPGDIETARTESWLASGDVQHCQLIKMPHHGKYHDQIPSLLDAVSADIAVICCSEKNPADEETLASLEEHSVTVWQTRYGDVHIESDGRELKVIQP